ncbi:MAG TPA: hypothetical protein PKD53_11325 [Chloroflexaceae bacterium]|nr:hypothetical protein [Chloroflexaceae bacterium]
MDITCKRCGEPIPADDVNLQSMAAKCRACNAVFSIADQVEPASGWAAPARLDVPLPERFAIERPAGGLRISWRWFTPAAIFLAVFALFWNGFLCVFFWGALSGGAGGFAMFASLHVLVGIGVAYWALAMFVNGTTVEASYGALAVRHGPLPALGNLDLPRDGIRQLYCVERVRRSRRSTTVSYSLQAVKADGGSVAVVKGLDNPEQALYLEQELERFLGIRDEGVRGELRK